MAGVSRLLQESTKQPLGLSTGSVAVFQELCKETIGSCWEAGITPCCCAAIAVLWLALAPERFPLQADTFSCAAGTAGKQKWSLILPSSARVSELTYMSQSLDNFQNDIIQFGNYLQAEQCTRPKRRGLCEGYSGSHPSATDLLHHGPTGHAWTGWSRDYHWLLEIWCQFQ